MKSNKFAALILVLCLVLCLTAPMASAASGTSEDPIVLTELGDLTAVSDSADFVYYQWTATESGKLFAEFSGDWICVISDGTDEVFNSNGMFSFNPSATISVTAGKVYSIKVGTFDNPFQGTVKAGSIAFSLSFASGSKNNPYPMGNAGNYEFAENEDAWFEVVAAKDMKFTIGDFMGVTIKDENGTVLEPNQTTMWGGQSYVYTMAAGDKMLLNVSYNKGAEDYASYISWECIHKGTYGYPYEAVIGNNSITTVAGENEKPAFSITAPTAGKFVLTITDADNGWYYYFGYKDRNSVEAPTDVTAEYEVAEGETLTFNVCAWDNENWQTLAGTVEFNIRFENGTAEYPYVISEMGDFTANNADGEYVYYKWECPADGILNINSEDSFIYSIGNEPVVYYPSSSEYGSSTYVFGGNTYYIAIAVGQYNEAEWTYVPVAGSLDFSLEYVDGSKDNPFDAAAVYQWYFSKDGSVWVKYTATKDCKLIFSGMKGDVVKAEDGTAYVPASALNDIWMPVDPSSEEAYFLDYEVYVSAGDTVLVELVSCADHQIGWQIAYKGSLSYPIEITQNGSYTANITGEGWDPAQYYVWTAPADGTLTIAVDTASAANGWEYIVGLMGQYGIEGDTNNSDTANEYVGHASTVTIDVVAGQTYGVAMNICAQNNMGRPMPGMSSVATGSVNFTFTFAEPISKVGDATTTVISTLFALSAVAMGAVLTLGKKK